MSHFKNPEAETMSTILFLHLSSLAITIYSSFIHNLFQIIIINNNNSPHCNNSNGLAKTS